MSASGHRDARRLRASSAPVMMTAATLSLVSAAFAQDAGLELFTAVPESPAFLFLGASPTEVTRPGVVRDFGVALISGIDEEAGAAGPRPRGHPLVLRPRPVDPVGRLPPRLAQVRSGELAALRGHPAPRATAAPPIWPWG